MGFNCLCFTSSHSLTGPVESVALSASFHGLGVSSVATKEMVPESLGGRTSQTFLLWDLLVQPHIRKFHRGL